MNVSGQVMKWTKLLDKLTIVDQTQQTAAELYSEITDQLPLLEDASYQLNYCVSVWFAAN